MWDISEGLINEANRLTVSSGGGGGITHEYDGLLATLLCTTDFGGTQAIQFAQDGEAMTTVSRGHM